jgi:hypothetical protein
MSREQFRTVPAEASAESRKAELWLEQRFGAIASWILELLHFAKFQDDRPRA